MAEKKVLTVADRTISAEVMKNVAAQLPTDGFELTEKLVGQTLTFDKVEVPTFDDGSKSFVGVYTNADKKRIRLGAGAFKGMRVMVADGIVVPASKLRMLENKAGVVLRSEASEIWDKSQYLHSSSAENTMSVDKDFVLPASLKIHAIVLKETPDGEARVNPFLYKGFRKVVTHYRKEKGNSYPTWEDFCEELKKEGDDRIVGLTAETKPTLSTPGRDKELRSMTFNLIASDYAE